MIFKSYLFLKINTREGKTEVYSCGYAKQSLLWYFCFLVIALFSLHTTVNLLLPHPVWLLTGPLLRLALENQELCKSPDLSENEMLNNNQPTPTVTDKHGEERKSGRTHMQLAADTLCLPA